MTSSRETLTVGLRSSVDAVKTAVDQIVAALQRPPGAHPENAQADVLRWSFGAVEALTTRLNEAAAVLVASQSHERWQRRFGSEYWPERKAELLDQLERDRDAGTTAWLQSWVAALTAGAWDECERLVAEPFDLADWGIWLPDRCAAIQDAVSQVPVDGARSCERLADVIELFLPPSDPVPGRQSAITAEPSTLDRLASTSEGGRIRLLLLLARVLARGADYRAPRLVAMARKLLAFADPGEEAQHLRAISATESYLERHGAWTGDPTIRWMEMMRSAGASDLGCLLEYLIRLRGIEPATESPLPAADGQASRNVLAEAQAMVDSLPDIAGVCAQLSALLEEPSDELTIALASRLSREEQFASAEHLLSTIGSYPAAMSLRVAELRAEIARGRGASPHDLADALARAGDQALWIGEYSLASSRYAESLELRRDHPNTLRSFGDSLVAQSWGQQAEVARPNLLRALELCARAHELDPVARETSWALLVEHHANLALSNLLLPDRGSRLWAAVAAAAKAVTLSPERADGWSFLAQDLVRAGASFSAQVAAQRYRQLSPESSDARDLVAITALNLGQPEPALAALAEDFALPEDGEAWFDALRGIAYRLKGDAGQAEHYLLAAHDRNPQVLYQQWIAEVLTENGKPQAEDHWRSIWRESDLDTIDGLEAAAWAATYQGLTTSARDLASRLAGLERLIAGDRTWQYVAGIAKIWESAGKDGWDDLGAAYGGIIALDTLQPTTRFVRALLQLAPGDPAALAARLDRLMAQRAAEVRQLFGSQPGQPAWEVEAEWLTSSVADDGVSLAVDALRQAMRAAMAGNEVVEDFDGSEDSQEQEYWLPAPRESSEQVPDVEEQSDTAIQVALPPSWFLDLEGRELTHEFFRRWLPDARAAEHRLSAHEAVQRPVRVRTEPECEPDQVWLGPPEAAVWVATVTEGQWYCPQPWLAALAPQRRLDAQPSAMPGLYAVAPPQDTIERLSSWNPAETVARVVLRAAQQRLVPVPRNERLHAETY